MTNRQFHVFLGVLMLVFAGLGYWSYRTIDFTPSESDSADTVPQVLVQAQPIESTDVETSHPAEQTPKPPVETPKPAEDVSQKPIPAKYADLGARLSKLISDKIVMKDTSYGTRVGTIETFMNVYDGGNTKVVNKYSSELITRVKKFQTEMKIQSDGLGDPETYQKMIDWLKTK